MQSNMFFLRFKRETMAEDVLVGVLTTCLHFPPVLFKIDRGDFVMSYKIQFLRFKRETMAEERHCWRLTTFLHFLPVLLKNDKGDFVMQSNNAISAVQT